MKTLTLIDKKGNEHPVPSDMRNLLSDQQSLDEAMMYQELMRKNNFRIDTSDPDKIRFVHKIDYRREFVYEWFDWLFHHYNLVEWIRTIVDNDLTLCY